MPGGCCIGLPRQAPKARRLPRRAPEPDGGSTIFRPFQGRFSSVLGEKNYIPKSWMPEHYILAEKISKKTLAGGVAVPIVRPPFNSGSS
jgi:hypothetical protein